MKPRTDTTTVTVHGLSFTVGYSYSPSYPAGREYPGGPPITPPEPEAVEIDSIYFEGDPEELFTTFSGSESLREAVALEIFEQLRDYETAMEEDRADALIEEMKLNQMRGDE